MTQTYNDRAWEMIYDLMAKLEAAQAEIKSLQESIARERLAREQAEAAHREALDNYATVCTELARWKCKPYEPSLDTSGVSHTPGSSGADVDLAT